MSAPIHADLAAVLSGATFFSMLWALALWHKAQRWQEYREQVRDYRVAPEAAAGALALALAAAEGALALAWQFDAGRGWAALGSAALLSVYGLAMAWNLARGRSSIDCGCGGEGQGIRWALVARNGVLALGALGLALLEPAAARTLLWLDFVTIVAAALALYAFYLIGNQLLANNPPQRWAR